jgi:Zn-dependent M16 (insulinase) family peptidase
MALRAPLYNQPESVPLGIGAKLINRHIIVPQLRLSGQAYAAVCQYDPLEGELVFLSGQDGHAMHTARFFDTVLSHIDARVWDVNECRSAILEAVLYGRGAARPRRTTLEALQAVLTGMNVDAQNERDEAMLGAGVTEVLEAIRGILVENQEHGGLCVFASDAMLNEAPIPESGMVVEAW